MVEAGTISASDLDLFFYTDSIDEAYEYVTNYLTEHALRGDPQDSGGG
jgi:hypothetical protein